MKNEAGDTQAVQVFEQIARSRRSIRGFLPENQIVSQRVELCEAVKFNS